MKKRRAKAFQELTKTFLGVVNAITKVLFYKPPETRKHDGLEYILGNYDCPLCSMPGATCIGSFDPNKCPHYPYKKED